MDKSTFWKWAVGLFWGFYVIFLLSSIPHLADWFRHLDGIMPDPADKIYWVLAYGKAIAVDGADVLLTLAFLRKMGEDKNGWDFVKIGCIVLFIFGFTCFSWYINWQYEVQFVTNEFALADQQLFFSHPVGASNPLVGSSFQLFAIVFTFISDTLLKKTDLKTAAQLEADANEFEAAKKQKERIKQLKKGRVENASIEMIDSGFHIVGHIVKKGRQALAKEEQNATQLAEVEHTSLDGEIEAKVQEDNGVDAIAKTPDKLETENTSEDSEMEEKDEGKEVLRDTSSPRSAPARSITIKEASKLLGLSESRVRELTGKGGSLRRTAHNKKGTPQKITMSSLEAFQKTRQKDEKKEPETGEIEAIKTSSNETHKSNGKGHHADTFDGLEKMMVSTV